MNADQIVAVVGVLVLLVIKLALHLEGRAKP